MKVEDIQIEKIGLFQFYLTDKITGETTTAEFTNIPKKIAVSLINQQIESFKAVNFVESIDFFGNRVYNRKCYIFNYALNGY